MKYTTTNRILEVLSYNNTTHTFKLIDPSTYKIISSREGIEGRFVSVTPLTGMGSGTFTVPKIGDKVLAMIEGYEDERGGASVWNTAWVLGYPEMRSLNIAPDAIGDAAQPGDKISRSADGSVEIDSPSGGIKHRFFNSWAQDTIIPGLNIKKDIWQTWLTRMRGGLQEWIWTRPPVEKRYKGPGKTSYTFVVSDGFEDEMARDDDVECGAETVDENVQYRNKIIIQAGSLSDGSDQEGSLAAGDDAGAAYRIISKQTAVRDAISVTPIQFTRLVFGRATGALKQLLGLFAWDDAGSSNTSVTFNEGGYGSVHGMTLHNKQAAGNINVTVSKDGGTGILIDVNGKAGVTIDYNGNITVKSLVADGKIKLGGTGKEQALVTKSWVEKVFKQWLLTEYNMHYHIGNMGSPTAPVVVPSQMDVAPVSNSDSNTNSFTYTIEGE